MQTATQSTNQQGADSATAAATLDSASLKDLLAALKARRADAKEERELATATAKLADLRTYAVRQAAWAAKARRHAAASLRKARKAAAALATLEAKLGIAPATEAEVAATLARLIADGRVAQTTPATEPCPPLAAGCSTTEPGADAE